MSRARMRRDRVDRLSLGRAPAETRRAPLMNRARWIALTFTAVFSVYAARLYDLQVTRYHEFATQSNNNYQRDEVIRALRGEIRTRDGVLLATNRMAVDLIYTGRIKDRPIDNWDKIRYLAGVPADKLVNGQPIEPDVHKEKEVTLARNIPADRIPALYEFTALQPNLELRERLERVYPHGKLAAHLLGYTREANDEEVKEGGYTLGDLVGASGLEASLEEMKVLPGRNGTRRVEVTANGRPQGDKVVDPGRKGQDVVLTIDSTLQAAAERALREALPEINRNRVKYGTTQEKVVKGAIIALDPRTNEVLALASSPTYDPNWFSQSPRPKELVQALTSPDAVMQNRVVQQFDSGSVFKPTSTLAFIERWGNKTFTCLPYIRFGGPRYNWHRTGSMGPMDGALAIAHSCNTWYYQAAISADPRTFTNYLSRRIQDFGFGKTSGLELIGEKTGNIPSIENFNTTWAAANAARKARGEAPLVWQPGQALSFAIGQDALLVTPAQIASALSTLENEGVRRPLTVLKAVGGQARPVNPGTRIPGNLRDFETVKRGMSMTTTRAGAYNGTAAHMLGPNFFPVRTAGKTGTAENAESHRKNYGWTNAWYEGYGPIGNGQTPNFLVVTFFQNGGEGSGPALTAATKMFAARWCVELDERNHARPNQQPCTGELDQMHKVMQTRAARAAASAAKNRGS
ncbi:peptidoglycan D,D-transpeptidase FtsI family protein [Deinococcus maricopensis]|uniref:beta-lactamase n=1 Tax=Deinococcus maricopensis (strain DSM 21211 / LMG 22137 / NRRL B-23946 / LB-34) TaxID=709986 RepID=E8UAC3_DEIML|nr:penicillin-binding transpeptidase domain-containing protein [Deinococcus maricopensis]ADV68012.1 Peptidoglycan glycosyltransferase [Deinococcus maricopensis DSM 21211]